MSPEGQARGYYLDHNASTILVHTSCISGFKHLLDTLMKLPDTAGIIEADDDSCVFYGTYQPDEITIDHVIRKLESYITKYV